MLKSAVGLEKLNFNRNAILKEAPFLASLLVNLSDFLNYAYEYFFISNSLKDSQHENFLITQKMPAPHPSIDRSDFRMITSENKENNNKKEFETKERGKGRESSEAYRSNESLERNSLKKNQNSDRSRNSSASAERRSLSSKRSSNKKGSTQNLSKLDRIMKLKVNKPEKESLVRKYVDESISAKDLKKAKIFSDETLLIQEEIERTNKEMKEMEGKKSKLLSIYEREVLIS